MPKICFGRITITNSSIFKRGRRLFSKEFLLKWDAIEDWAIADSADVNSMVAHEYPIIELHHSNTYKTINAIEADGRIHDLITVLESRLGTKRCENIVSTYMLDRNGFEVRLKEANEFIKASLPYSFETLSSKDRKVILQEMLDDMRASFNLSRALGARVIEVYCLRHMRELYDGTLYYVGSAFRRDNGDLGIPASFYTETVMGTGYATLSHDDPDYDVFLWLVPQMADREDPFIGRSEIVRLRPKCLEEMSNQGLTRQDLLDRMLTTSECSSSHD